MSQLHSMRQCNVTVTMWTHLITWTARYYLISFRLCNAGRAALGFSEFGRINPLSGKTLKQQVKAATAHSGDEATLEGHQGIPQTPGLISRLLPPPLNDLRNLDGVVSRSDVALEYLLDLVDDQVELTVGNNSGLVGQEIGLRRGRLVNSVAVRDMGVISGVEEGTLGVIAGVVKGLYGVLMEAEVTKRVFGYEVITRHSDLLGLIAQEERIYGFRIKVRHFGISFSGDIDSLINPQNGGPFEFFWQYKTAAVAVLGNVMSNRLGVSVSLRGYNGTILSSVNERQIDAQLGFGRAWQLQGQIDLPDQNDRQVILGAGFGRLNRAFVFAGAGIGDDGVPRFTATVNLKNYGIGANFINDEFGLPALQGALNVGRYTITGNLGLFAI